MKHILKLTAVAMAVAFAGAAQAGSFIIAGTDADDHGSASAGVNLNGWSFMQKAIENISVGVTNTNQTVYSLGSSSSALAAAQSAFNLSSLAGAGGWNFVSIDGASNISTFLSSGSVGAGIIMLDSGNSNVTGGLDSAEAAALTANATALNSFVGNGGGLFSQANSLGWLSALIPGITVTSFGSGGFSDGLSLTSAGNTAFPGLTNANLSSGPYHAGFSNIGSLPILATSNTNGYNVILGSSAGSITAPVVTAVPEAETYAMFLVGLGLMGAVARRRKAK